MKINPVKIDMISNNSKQNIYFLWQFYNSQYSDFQETYVYGQMEWKKSQTYNPQST